jgi:hypothetical protein
MAVELGAGRQAQELVRRVVDLAPPEREVYGNRHGHDDRGVLILGVDRSPALREHLLDIGNGGHRFVSILEALEQLRGPILLADGVGDLYRSAHDLGESGFAGLGRHQGSVAAYPLSDC